MYRGTTPTFTFSVATTVPSFKYDETVVDVYYPIATEISYSCFQDCANLRTAQLPSITSISNYAFGGCISLTSITYNGTMEQWNAIELGEKWNYGVPATEVVCTDGSVSLTT